MTDPDGAREACAALGAAFAGAGWDLIVYSGKPGFVEADVVRGYVGSGKATPGSIQVRAPQGKTGFDELSDHPELFVERPDPSPSWEVSFYRSLFGVDGVLLVGGGRTTLVTGLIALTLQIPVAAAAMFGGNARSVWELLATPGQEDDSVDTAAMGGVWREDSAHRLVQSLDAQRAAGQRRRRAEQRMARRESRITRIGLVVVAALLLLVVLGLEAAWGWSLGAGWSVALLALMPAVTGAAGALIRTSLDGSGQWGRAAVLGGAAGLVTGLLYVASQLIGAPDVLQGTSQVDSVRRLLFFVLPIGFVAGLTFDAIYARWRGRDVSQVATVDAITKSPQEQR